MKRPKDKVRLSNRTTRKKSTSTQKSLFDAVAKKPTKTTHKKPTKAQTKAKRSEAGKKNYKGSKLQQINKLATQMQTSSGTKQITVPKLSRREATKRAANKLRLGL